MMYDSGGNLVFLVSILFCVSGSENEITSEHSLELTQSSNLGRQELVQETCNRLSLKWSLEDLPRSLLEHILVDDKHKLLYCYVPKVACTNWKRILMILEGKWNDTDVLSVPASLAHSPGMFRNLSTVSKEERDVMLENYHKMIIVRNPFERLLSAYRNKLEGDLPSAKYFQDRVGRRIIKAFRENPSNESLEYGHDVTFKEFALFLTNNSKELADIVNNEHWQPITTLCHPCLIKYTLDRVGRRIIKAFRENPSNESLEYGHDVTFKEFALFLTNNSKELADIVNNEHWQPITTLCHPCLIKYTLVGKYETLLDDSLLALHTINASHIQFPRLAHTSGTSEKLRKYYSQLDLPLIRKLYKFYKYDYKIFNYDLDNIVGYDLG